jgi:hypothetical protein
MGMAQTAPKATRSPEELEGLKRDLAGKIFALLLVVFAVASGALMPPIQNQQIAQIESQLQRPVIDVVIAVVMFFIAGWQARVPAAIGTVLLLFASAQYVLYNNETAAARGTIASASGWTNEQVASSAHGSTHNTPDTWGYATASWSGTSYSLDLHSTTGTTQQGYHMNAGSSDSQYVFFARIVERQGILTSTCPMLFGIASIRDYYTFRIEQGAGGTYTADVYQITGNPGVDTGFTADVIDQSAPLPYIGHWDLLQPWAADDITLMISAQGNNYSFFVDGREVFQRPIESNPAHEVAVGLTTIGNNNPADTICGFDQLSLKVKPQ